MVNDVTKARLPAILFLLLLSPVSFMSGSTKVCKERMHYLICMETPCISFARNPNLKPGQIDNTERDYHDRAKRNFEAYLSDVVPVLDEFIESIILDRNDRYCLARYSDAVQELYEWDRAEIVRSGVKKCKCRIHIKHMYLEATFSTIPSESVLSELQTELSRFFHQYDASRRDDAEKDRAFE